MPEVLVKEYRGDVVENVHYGSVAIISSTGETIAYTGDIEKQTYMRSASKPVQVLPTLVKGLHRRFNLTDEDHEPYHFNLCRSSGSQAEGGRQIKPCVRKQQAPALLFRKALKPYAVTERAYRKAL